MVKYKLATPVEFDSKTYSEIELPRPKGKHLKSIPSNPTFDDIMKVAVKISSIPNKVFEEMDGYDYVSVGGIIGDFLESGPGTGKKKSRS